MSQGNAQHNRFRLLLVGLTAGLLVAGTASAETIYYVPDAGGQWHVAGNWSLGRCPTTFDDVEIIVSGTSHKAVYYDWSGVSDFDSVTVDGDGPTYGAIWHLEYLLHTWDLYLGQNGEAWHWMEGPAFLWVTDEMFVGHQDPGEGFFYMATTADVSAGLYVGDICYVGYNGTGHFDHVNGFAEIADLSIGQYAPGTYELSGWSLDESTLTVPGTFVIGNSNEGTFEQTNGTVDQTSTAGIQMGFNSGGVGTYNMKGGELYPHHLSIGWLGDGYFNHTAGYVATNSNINIGCEGTQPHMAWYKVSDDDGDPELNVGGDLRVGPYSLGKFEQLSGGTVIVDGTLKIWQGTTDPGETSYFYMGLSADWFEADEVYNYSGYYDQDGGTLQANSFTNESTQGVNLDNNADLQSYYFTHSAGTLWLWRNALLQGPYFSGTYYLCNLTNDATVQMGNAVFNGGTLRAYMTNNGTFDYYQGDCSETILVNHGTFNMNNDFACLRLENHANINVPASRTLTANGSGYASAIENNGNLSLLPGSSIVLNGPVPMVNNGPMYAGAPSSDPVEIVGDVENNDYLLPCHSSLPAGALYIDGTYTASSGANLRIRIHGTDATDYDRLLVQGHATLAGRLDVRLTDGFVPALGDRFTILRYESRTGQFNQLWLPDLPAGLEWDVQYWGAALILEVIEPPPIPGDGNGDGVVDLADYRYFQDCMAGPNAVPDPMLMTVSECRQIFDFDTDTDVDLFDFTEFSMMVGS
jgi:hypothetical protein